jgi:hypothetical protein
MMSDGKILECLEVAKSQSDAEISALKEKLNEAEQIIKSFHLEYVDYSVLNNLSGHNNHNARWARRFLGMEEEMSLDDARSFLKENENVG